MKTVTEVQPVPRPAPRLVLAPPPAEAPRRAWSRLSWLLGLGLLTASLVGATHVLNSRPNANDTAKAPVERTFSGPPGVVCLGTVDLEGAPGGFIPLAPTQPGEVTHVNVYEGQPVKKGDVLLRVDDEAQVQTVGLAEIGVRLAEAQQMQAQQGLEQLRAAVEGQQAAVEAVKHKVAAAEYRLHRERYLFNLATPQSNADAINAATEELAAAKSAIAGEEAKLRAIQANKPDAKLREAEENVALGRQRLEQARLAVRKCGLEAPADGIVLRINAAKGTVLGPQTRQAPVLFAPAGPRLVRAEVEQEFAHRVQTGMAAMVYDEANGQTTWQGRVKRLGAAYLPKRSAGGAEGLPFAGSDSRVLECVIELDAGQPQPVIGQKVRVNIGTHGQ